MASANCWRFAAVKEVVTADKQYDFQYFLIGGTEWYTSLVVAWRTLGIFRFQGSKCFPCDSVIKMNFGFEDLKTWYCMSHTINGYQDIMWVKVLRKISGCLVEVDPSCCSGFRGTRRLKFTKWCWLVDVAGEHGWPAKWLQKTADGLQLLIGNPGLSGKKIG